MIKINNIKNFNLDETVTCGQIFRYAKENEWYIIILQDRVIKVSYKDNTLFADSNKQDDLENIIMKYFDLYRDYEEINKYICNNDKNMEILAKQCQGLKMINSYPFETFISYIISANNSVPSIKKSVDKISQRYGEKVEFEGKDYYLFPTPMQLRDVSIADYRKCSVGFRDKYIYNIVQKINNDSKYLDNLNNVSTAKAFEILLSENGIGPKVASCILLFAYQKLDVFPVDTWVKKIMLENYNISGEKNIIKKAKELYGEYSAIAIQYMFHYSRNKRK